MTSAREILRAARAEGQQVLLEPQGLALLEAVGIRVPRYALVPPGAKIAERELDLFFGDKVVLKCVSPDILHKTEVGGVSVVTKSAAEVGRAVAAMRERLSGHPIAGFLVEELVPFSPALGNELLDGARYTPDFGPVLTLGAGGIYTEFLGRNLKAGCDLALFAPGIGRSDRFEQALSRVTATAIATGRLRGQKPRIEGAQLVELLTRIEKLAQDFIPELVSEIEMNPVVIHEGRAIALDILVKLTTSAPAPARSARPLAKLKNLLEPRSLAVLGASERLNTGRLILNNVLAAGFAPEQVYVIRPDGAGIAGCRGVRSVGELPDAVDVLVVALAAAQVPSVVTEAIETRKAESIIVIPGGLGEKKGSESLADQVEQAIGRARTTSWGGPIVNGGNCLGIRSLPGRYDTLFIPHHKLPPPAHGGSPLAVLSQSGALAVVQASRLAAVNPTYVISAGNQIDLTLGDYLTHLKDDPRLRVFAIYAEGFVPGDGLRLLRVAEELTEAGKSVILYRAGRTREGLKASASHTAALAGDYVVTRALAESVGVLVAETLSDFVDLSLICTLFADVQVRGTHLAAVSNAGFECVAFCDNLGSLELAELTAPTRDKLDRIFVQARIGQVVEVQNPVDLTPMTADEPYAQAVRDVMSDPSVDVGIIGCVPLTGALQTLPPGRGHGENVLSGESVAMRLVRLRQEVAKPWVAVVDAGALYDPMVRIMAEGGVATFRTADRALRLLGRFCSHRLGLNT